MNEINMTKVSVHIRPGAYPRVFCRKFTVFETNGPEQRDRNLGCNLEKRRKLSSEFWNGI